MVKFISYDGKYPCLYMGTLKIEIDGKLYSLEDCLISGGRVWFDDDWDEHVEQDVWSVTLKHYPELQPYMEEIIEIVNDNIPEGCCGGCV